MPYEAAIGPARVIEVRAANWIGRAEIESRQIGRGERILFKTANSPRAWRAPEFIEDYIALTRDAAEYLVERGVRTVGIDYLSIGPPDEEGDSVHRLLLSAGIWILEGLDLTAVQPGNYDLVCLPLSIPGADGAPARALLRR
jgi:arylformamidase